MSIVVFADDNKDSKYGPLDVLTGLMIRKLEANSTFHTIAWMSQNSKNPMRSRPIA